MAWLLGRSKCRLAHLYDTTCVRTPPPQREQRVGWEPQWSTLCSFLLHAREPCE